MVPKHKHIVFYAIESCKQGVIYFSSVLSLLRLGKINEGTAQGALCTGLEWSAAGSNSCTPAANA